MINTLYNFWWWSITSEDNNNVENSIDLESSVTVVSGVWQAAISDDMVHFQTMWLTCALGNNMLQKSRFVVRGCQCHFDGMKQDWNFPSLLSASSTCQHKLTTTRRTITTTSWFTISTSTDADVCTFKNNNSHLTLLTWKKKYNRTLIIRKAMSKWLILDM